MHTRSTTFSDVLGRAQLENIRLGLSTGCVTRGGKHRECSARQGKTSGGTCCCLLLPERILLKKRARLLLKNHKDRMREKDHKHTKKYIFSVDGNNLWNTGPVSLGALHAQLKALSNRPAFGVVLVLGWRFGWTTSRGLLQPKPLLEPVTNREFKKLHYLSLRQGIQTLTGI